MINHPLTILRRTPAFAKPGLIRRNPPVQVGEGTCQVRRRQPVLIRYQIREVSGSRRTGATLLFLADPRPSPAAVAAATTSPKTRLPHPSDIPLFPEAPHTLRCSTPPGSAATHFATGSSGSASQPVTCPALPWQLAASLNFCQQPTLSHHVSPTWGESSAGPLILR